MLYSVLVMIFCFIRGSIGWHTKRVLWIGNVRRKDVFKMNGMIANMKDVASAAVNYMIRKPNGAVMMTHCY
jgi:hypothetical protein